MYDAVVASRPRCLAVAAGLTAALWGAAAVLVGQAGRLRDDGAPGSGHGVAALCFAALLVAVAWAWLQAMAGVADAWSGAPSRSGLVRRLALAACGAALAGALTGPAHAVDSDGPDVLIGLPLPERAEGPAHPRTSRVVVRAGDCLWTIAARDVGPRATEPQVARRWHQVYAANRAVIGPDPDLIRPGQVLTLGKEHP